MPYIVYDQLGAAYEVSGSPPASGGGGGTTTPVAAGPSGSRCAIDMGAIYNQSLAPNALYGIYKAVANAANTGSYSPAAYYDRLLKQPYAYSVVGYSLINASAAAFNVLYYKNGSSIATFNIPATVGQYTLGHTKGTYSFAVGDTFRIVVQPTGSTVNMQIDALVEWT